MNSLKKHIVEYLRSKTGYYDLKAMYEQAIQRVPVRTVEQPNLEFIRTDKFGNHWYEFKNIEQVAYVRIEAYWIACFAADLRVTPEELVQVLTTLNDKFVAAMATQSPTERTRLHAEFATLVNATAERMTIPLETRTLTALAKTFLVMGDEPLLPDGKTPWSDVTTVWNAKKQYVFDNDPESRAFFLSKAAKQLNSMKDIEIGVLQSFLSELPYHS